MAPDADRRPRAPAAVHRRVPRGPGPVRPAATRRRGGAVTPLRSDEGRDIAAGDRGGGFNTDVKVTRAGSTVTVTNAAHNGALAAGGSTSFGFGGTPGTGACQRRAVRRPERRHGPRTYGRTTSSPVRQDGCAGGGGVAQQVSP
ncbi:cellulose binding domain-containing protein [Streptomyces sp. NPDC048737]|uniref:cellulose binding domain-containing protein n=1 Tax=unclassified Streptomyces TaxID=2593676 RepID=UPI00341730EE